MKFMVEVAEKINMLPRVPGGKLLQFISPGLEGRDQVSEVAKTTEVSKLYKFRDESIHSFTNLHRVNDIRGINNFFCTVNRKLYRGGSFVGCVETLEHRRNRLFKKFPKVINIAYYGLDFVFKRIFPKFKFTEKIYFFLTNGRNRALSKSEILGRLVYCGFDIRKVEEINNMLYFKAEKVGEPSKDPKPSAGVLLRINRIGHCGKPIVVYKFRTMHPYAQYIQQYVFEQNNLQEGGKFANDFRITKWGRWMRKCWIDEIPMIYNILRGDLKLVGVRPLSEHYLSLYSAEHKSLRVQGKPGLIPPFYADMPKNIDEIMESESRYIRAYVQDPWSTDLSYGVKAFQNIFLNKARSH